MKRSLRAISAALCALLLLGLLAACGSGEAEVPVSQITSAVSAALGKSDSMAASDGMFLGLTGTEASELGEYEILVNRYGANIDEYGVFKLKNAKEAKSFQTTAEAYLARRLEVWMEEYMPEEKPKLERAEVRVNGKYVIYCILSDADKTAAFDAFASQLG